MEYMQQVLQDYIEKYKDRVDQAIAQELKRRLKEISDISPHLLPILTAMQELSVGGKRLRAILTILGYELAGNKMDEEILQAAVVMELFHLGLLIQDDVMDRDRKRRGVATIQTRYVDLHLGESVAILAGDYTFGWGLEILAGLKLDKERVNKAIGVWGRYFTRVGYGQTLDCMAIADEATVLQILKLKSGEYSCELPLILGATLGGARAELVQKLTEYSMELGWVFQLRDDWLGEYGESKITGKPVGSDSREGKKTLATMYGKQRLEAEIKKHWEEGREYTSNEVMRELLAWVATREN